MKTHEEYIKEWNVLHCKYINEGTPQYRNEKMADYCEEMIIKAKKVYYDSGESMMTDLTYDRFEENLKSLRPDSKLFDKVGS